MRISDSLFEYMRITEIYFKSDNLALASELWRLAIFPVNFICPLPHWHRSAIERVLAQPHAGPTIVVTHHAPSAMSLPAGERLHESAGAFASDLSDVLWRYQPELWVHGHVHSAADYRVGNTRVLCNPRGIGGRIGQRKRDGVRSSL